MEEAEMSNESDFAFPHQWQAMDGTPMGVHGMTLRDYFAAAALQGILAGDMFKELGDMMQEENDEIDDAQVYANLAYLYADALLKRRKEK
jgi:hypothetical protein